MTAITCHVRGAPFQVGEAVSVVDSIDRDIYDTSAHLGRDGVVSHLDYLCGCGQRTPDDPMIGVRFDDGAVEEFWREELCARGAK